MKALLTGSRVYGTPRKDSDLDIVLLASEEEVIILKDAVRDIEPIQESHPDLDYPGGSHVFRLGPVNLLVVTDEMAFKVWAEGTFDLKSLKPVSRDTAVEHLSRLRKKHGITPKEESKTNEF